MLSRNLRDIIRTGNTLPYEDEEWKNVLKVITKKVYVANKYLRHSKIMSSPKGD